MGSAAERLAPLAGLLAAAGLRAWMSTLHARTRYYDPTVDPARRDFRRPCIFLLWHEYLLYPLHFRAHGRISMLLSRHRDAQWLTGLAKSLGFGLVRGSSTRGGAAALRTMLASGGETNFAVTPDGPQGPRRTLAPGAIYLASRLGMPLVPMGIGADRPWRLPTWDRFALPRPYSRVRGVIGPALEIPPDVDRDGLETYRVAVERLLLELTDEAEGWAEDGRRRPGERPVVRRPMPLEAFRRLRREGEGVRREAPAEAPVEGAARHAA